jgi:Flp pilus assembly secretin CpaC
MFRLLVPSALVGAVLCSMSAPVLAQDALVVTIDQARVMRIDKPVSTIVIGNPAIADASMPDQNTLILTAKSYGETNLLMLDEEGSVIAEHPVVVSAGSYNTISVYRGTARSTMSCAPDCLPSPQLGDAADSYTLAQSYATTQASQ